MRTKEKSSNVEILFGKDSQETLTKMMGVIKKGDMSASHIASTMKFVGDLTWAGLHLVAIENGEETVARRIDKAMEISKKSIIDDLKKAVENGKGMEYLSTMSYVDKVSLRCEIRPKTVLDTICLSLLEASIETDLSNIAKENGFDSVEEWREYNSRTVKDRMPALAHAVRSRRYL